MKPAPRRRRAQKASELRETAGELLLFGRLLASPPDARALRDSKAIYGHAPALEKLQVEFTRLFSVPGPGRMLSHQSAYTDTLHLEAADLSFDCGVSPKGGEFSGYLRGESCAEARRWYAAAGYAPEDPAPGMADHISSQLGFLAYLYLGEARSLEMERPDDAAAFKRLREEFFISFIERWGGTFTERLRTNVLSGFYRGVGRRLLTFLRKVSPSRWPGVLAALGTCS